MYNEATRYHVVARSQSEDLLGIRHFRDIGPALKHYWINVTCLLVCLSREGIDPDNVCVIGQGRLSLHTFGYSVRCY